MKIFIYLIFTVALFLQGCSDTQSPTTPDQSSGISAETSDPNNQSNSETNSAGASSTALENYEAYRQLMIQNIVAITGNKTNSYGDDIPGSMQESKTAVEAALQSTFDEHEDFLQTLFARQTPILNFYLIFKNMKILKGML